ncbi:DUF7219 family protein [Laspinema olomoucense]|uniref:Uncharacterized protein n=1 Tax=Laspinema olomoucense D3b TaxID=2953688 RepID=A0ABT2ND21_9CYAN|nr:MULTISPECIES: hypothetical protein [unclassified Laspinema]MCT7975289.1 hypothetical protein [Laspinema sp. D3d]MCT7980588.1 hypothetical protein [Laspinema sp. D3b]MCT7991141.1 hypothetical protein [Laspinema sp. D3a]MCT7996153.1 hypothetical protein [Laspinema sp. D3c]
MSSPLEHPEKLHYAESSHPLCEDNFLPQLMVDQSNLRKFGQKVSVIRELEMKGELSRFESSQEIKRLWNHLQQNAEF